MTLSKWTRQADVDDGVKPGTASSVAARPSARWPSTGFR